MIDTVLVGLFDDWDMDNDLLIITSDHGNIEEKNHRQHSRNPVPTILFGRGHSTYSAWISDLADIAGVVRDFLELYNA
jgi:phosphopentomutase